MTLEEFNNMSFYCGMQIEYSGKVFPLASVDFQEGLIAIIEVEQEDPEDEELSWKRCENCTLITEAIIATGAPASAAGSNEIEYKKQEGASAWFVNFNGKLIGKIVVEKHTDSQYVSEGDCKVFASDHSIPKPQLIPGSPFKTMNHAKAALEYHFRALLDRRTEITA